MGSIVYAIIVLLSTATMILIMEKRGVIKSLKSLESKVGERDIKINELESKIIRLSSENSSLKENMVRDISIGDVFVAKSGTNYKPEFKDKLQKVVNINYEDGYLESTPLDGTPTSHGDTWYIKLTSLTNMLWIRQNKKDLTHKFI